LFEFLKDTLDNSGIKDNRSNEICPNRSCHKLEEEGSDAAATKGKCSPWK
jgi:hypothetical protein